MGFIKINRGNGYVWLNTDHIIRVSAAANGSRIMTTTTDDDGKTQSILCVEDVDQVMEMIAGTGVEIVQPFPRS